MSPVAEQLLTPLKPGATSAPPLKQRTGSTGLSPSSYLALVIVALVIVQPLWSVLVKACSWAAWLGCSCILWEAAKGFVLPRVKREHSAIAHVGLMLVTFVTLRLFFGWHTPLPQLSGWYWAAVAVPSTDTFIGLDTIGGLASFAFAGGTKRSIFPSCA